MNTKQCKECQSDIPSKAKRCPNCTADQRSWFSRHPVLTILGLLVAVPMTLSSLTDSNSSSGSSNQAPVNTPPTWEYETSIDEFTGNEHSFASVLSTNTLNFDFPYNGGSRFILVVRDRNTGDGPEVIIKTDNGQFQTYDETIQVRFDEGEPVTYRISGSDDGSSDVLFINNASGFIANVRDSSTIKIEAPFFDEGRQVIYFNTANYQGLPD